MALVLCYVPMRIEKMKNIRDWVLGLVTICVLACGPVGAGIRDTTLDGQNPDAVEETSAPLGTRVPIRVAGIEIQVEIADEPSEHSRGLMFRESLEENHGMLFVYATEQTRGFWMKNTLIPLDIAYADREGRIVDIQQMEPQVTDTHLSKAPMMYALEMNQGWFEANGVRVGDRVEF